jgi:hypothetical protein
MFRSSVLQIKFWNLATIFNIVLRVFLTGITFSDICLPTVVKNWLNWLNWLAILDGLDSGFPPILIFSTVSIFFCLPKISFSAMGNARDVR